MAIRNNHWYNLNEQRYYPVDDVASAISDQGDLLPASLIADLKLRWPLELGKYAFLSAVTLTARLITVMIEVSDTLDNSSGSTLVAGVTVPNKEAFANRTYTLQAFTQGAGGFIVFGSVDLAEYSGRFSTPAQSLLTPRAARPVRRPPVRTLGIENSKDFLTGLVNLSANTPIKLKKTSKVIDGILRTNVISVGLSPPLGEISVAGSAVESVFSEFSGPCGKRVGSKTCGDPQPVESINGITPNCDGVITLEFQGCAVVGRNVEDCGVIVDCNVGLSSSCEPPYLPELETGLLPNELPPIIIRPPSPPTPPVIPDFSFSESVSTVLSLPYCDNFSDGNADSFFPAGISYWSYINDSSPFESSCCDGPPISDSEKCQGSGGSGISYATLQTAAQGVTNISLWPLDVQTLFRKYTTDVKILAGQPGSQGNAGIVINYRTINSSSINYLLAQLDVVNKQFGIYFFNGLSLVPLGTANVPSATINRWYRITFKALPDPANLKRVKLTAQLADLETFTAVASISGSLASGIWGTDSGVAGLYAKRSRSYFSFWRVDEDTEA
jgi:hypothetical protein